MSNQPHLNSKYQVQIECKYALYELYTYIDSNIASHITWAFSYDSVSRHKSMFAWSTSGGMPTIQGAVLISMTILQSAYMFPYQLQAVGLKYNTALIIRSYLASQ